MANVSNPHINKSFDPKCFAPLCNASKHVMEVSLYFNPFQYYVAFSNLVEYLR